MFDTLREGGKSPDWGTGDEIAIFLIFLNTKKNKKKLFE
jgi:hypothetical protein